MLLQEAIVDSSLVQDIVPVDSLIADSIQNAGTFMENLSQEVAETGELLVTGQWRVTGSQLVEQMSGLLINFVPKLLSAFLVLLLLYLLYHIARKLLSKLLSRTKFIEAGLAGLINKSFSVAAWIFIGVMVLAQFGVNINALLAGLSVVGIAVGLAAQDTLQNFISGITILIDRPFRVGHFIEIEGTYGRIEEITLRSTRLRTINNEMMVMPNLQMINQKVINHTQLGALRIEVPFGIAYKEYPLEARKVVLKLTENDERIDFERPPDVVVTGLNNSSVDMILRFHIKDSGLAMPISREYLEKIREALREADIEIPFPHLQLFVDEAKALEKFLDSEES